MLRRREVHLQRAIGELEPGGLAEAAARRLRRDRPDHGARGNPDRDAAGAPRLGEAAGVERLGVERATAGGQGDPVHRLRRDRGPEHGRAPPHEHVHEHRGDRPEQERRGHPLEAAPPRPAGGRRRARPRPRRAAPSRTRRGRACPARRRASRAPSRLPSALPCRRLYPGRADRGPRRSEDVRRSARRRSARGGESGGLGPAPTAPVEDGRSPAVREERRVANEPVEGVRFGGVVVAADPGRAVDEHEVGSVGDPGGRGVGCVLADADAESLLHRLPHRVARPGEERPHARARPVGAGVCGEACRRVVLGIDAERDEVERRLEVPRAVLDPSHLARDGGADGLAAREDEARHPHPAGEIGGPERTAVLIRQLEGRDGAEHGRWRRDASAERPDHRPGSEHEEDRCPEEGTPHGRADGVIESRCAARGERSRMRCLVSEGRPWVKVADPTRIVRGVAPRGRSDNVRRARVSTARREVDAWLSPFTDTPQSSGRRTLSTARPRPARSACGSSSSRTPSRSAACSSRRGSFGPAAAATGCRPASRRSGSRSRRGSRSCSSARASRT